MKRQCDTLILGSGISGMTLALLFGGIPERVLILERSAVPGGAMQRFYREGIGLDTGFHFTGGISDSFADMLELLEIRDRIDPVPVRQTVRFSDTGRIYELPRGLSGLEEYLCSKFPESTDSIRTYFETERKVFAATPLFHLRGPGAFADGSPDLEEDHITLGAFLDKLRIHGELRGLLCGLCSCHGTAPCEISFANHARIHYGLSHDPVRLRSGGQSLVDAFLQKSAEKGVSLLKKTTVLQWGTPDENNQIHSAILTDGSQVEFRKLIFTQSPAEILKLLPPEKVRASFRERIETLSDSCGFFTWHAVLDNDPALPFEEGIFSTLSSPDLDSILMGKDPLQRSTGYSMTLEKKADQTLCRCITGFQTVFPEETAPWTGSSTGKRPPSYCDYKKHKEKIMEELLLEAFPAYRGRLHTLASSSMLTFRDYLFHSGSAYGVRQKMDQDNLFGRLPVRNFYTASQSSILPGIVGSMLTGLVLFRKLAGEECYRKLLQNIQENRSL